MDEGYEGNEGVRAHFQNQLVVVPTNNQCFHVSNLTHSILIPTYITYPNAGTLLPMFFC